MFLLDTNICIYCIKKRPETVLKRVRSHDPFELYISAITVAELQYGVAKSNRSSQNESALLKFLTAYSIVPFTDQDASYFGHIRSQLEKQGNVIGPYDLQIAAQSLRMGFTLVTNNEKEFNRVPNLKVENWV